ncbi:hypothetical protein HYC85_020881 [Camellia sinensis]|uniref:Uncharacterized protein n=1 Tax=Camellia sinensis TaxID=4442 RepID=A0A7J7GR29_CAMSI|nr:hypothetical protein HYC85_020881 [Camellia sinensis]
MKHVASLSRPSRRKSRIFSYKNHESRRSLPTPVTRGQRLIYGQAPIRFRSSIQRCGSRLILSSALDVCSEPLVLGLCTSDLKRLCHVISGLFRASKLVVSIIVAYMIYLFIFFIFFPSHHLSTFLHIFSVGMCGGLEGWSLAILKGWWWLHVVTLNLRCGFMDFVSVAATEGTSSDENIMAMNSDLMKRIKHSQWGKTFLIIFLVF